MAPESPANLILLDLQWQDGRLESRVNRYDTHMGDHLYVSWNATECPENYIPIGINVAFAWLPEGTQWRQYRARVDRTEEGYEWLDVASDPHGAMLILILPPEYVYHFPETHPDHSFPAPIRFKPISKNQMAFYYWFPPGRFTVEWWMEHAPAIDMEQESVQLNREARHRQIPTKIPIHVDPPIGSGPDNVHSSYPKPMNQPPDWHEGISIVTINIGEGDYIGQDKVVHEDDVHGDKVVKDEITNSGFGVRMKEHWRGGLPSPLLVKLKRTLLECGPFANSRMLTSAFADDRIAPWRNEISEGGNPKERVDLFVSDFLNRKNLARQSVLVLFLQALHDDATASDECSQRLDDIAIEVAAAMSTELPPMARANLWRASVTRGGESAPDHLGGYTLPPAEPDPTIQFVPLPPGLSPQFFAEHLESLKNKERTDWLPVSFLEKGLKAARSVGRVEHQGRKIGTAFLIAPDLVLTNAHVVRDIPVLEQGGVRFNVGLQLEPQWYYFAEQITSSPVKELDFALLRLKTPVTATPVMLSTEIAYQAQPANILQYPQGEALQVALRRNEVVHVDPTRLYYVTDTEECSSGSPVFNDDWSVIALHRAGIVDEVKRPVKNANQGVPITAIEPMIQSYLNGG
ncbi:MAG TPA: serine protease [Anaerolineales bacterium]|nr:serine protease [Anaerolineales bacterium]